MPTIEFILTNLRHWFTSDKGVESWGTTFDAKIEKDSSLFWGLTVIVQNEEYDGSKLAGAVCFQQQGSVKESPDIKLEEWAHHNHIRVDTFSGEYAAQKPQIIVYALLPPDQFVCLHQIKPQNVVRLTISCPKTKDGLDYASITDYSPLVWHVDKREYADYGRKNTMSVSTLHSGGISRVQICATVRRRLVSTHVHSRRSALAQTTGRNKNSKGN